MGPLSKYGKKNTAVVGGRIHPVHDDLGYYDVRTTRRLKRRRPTESLNPNASNEDNVNKKKTVRRNLVLNEEEEVEGGDEEIFVDNDYEMFLSKLGHSGWGNVCSISDSEDNAVERLENGADYSDPHYKMFLESLRVDGNSYALEIPLSSEMSLVIKYEKDVGSSNAHRLRNLDALEHLLGGGNMKDDKTLWDSSKRDRADESCQDHFNYLTKDDDAGVSNREKNLSGVSKRGKLETQHKLRDSGLLMREKPVRGVSKNARMESQENLPVSGQFNCEKTLRGISKKDRMEDNFRGTEKESPLNMRNNEKEAENFHKKPTQKDDHFVEESYQVYLNSLKKGVDPTFVKQEIEIEDDENSSDSDLIVISEDPFIHGNHTPFVTSKFKEAPIDLDGDIGHGSQGKGDHSQFREKLMDVLTKEFDQKEYEELLKEINAERTKEGFRRLRGREIAYSIGSCAPSYIDLNNDLKMMIDSYKTNPHKVLVLLRGFFFWLKNITLGGVFQPWKDPSCSELLSQP
ncbi:hypothetical protein HS088_TW15G00987 [Tripterygium wilfordii]|uniref:Uncharacterized protein n=1 Tax=Tripterygium wilfordii TaxID=458696 RepID=A0A7J7CN34_TRIWF|nr:uncharacterized protein LOC120016349 [Tripterygium wilfordii]KAF5735480.1 hypothetical protein HS088_TW15G00987 [Tripterygium wilfordii]